LIRIRNERGSINEVTKAAPFLAIIIYSSIYKFLKILYPAFSLFCVFSSKRI